MFIVLFISSGYGRAQIPGVGLVTGIIKKVIVAIDLKVQRLQNQTIALQNAEQVLENKLHLGSLDDISGWLSKEKELYAQYYQELAQVKSYIADYDEVKRLIKQQGQLLSEYQSARNLMALDTHFSPAELRNITNIYNGIMEESVRNIDEVLTAVNNFSAQMSDGERLEVIRHAAGQIQNNLNDLRQFNRRNTRLSVLRARSEQDKQQVRKLYGL